MVHVGSHAPVLALAPGPRVPGSCFALPAGGGSLAVSLAAPVPVTSVAIEHAAAALLPKVAATSSPTSSGAFAAEATGSGVGTGIAGFATTDAWRSAPREFEAYGFGPGDAVSRDGGRFLGRWAFEIAAADGYEPVQAFAVDADRSMLAHAVRFDIVSNHGSEALTCLYGVRVHGGE
jgi:hypothetical protein